MSWFGSERAYDSVHWGVHGCELFGVVEGERCPNAAELMVMSDEWRGVPACLVCADAYLERREAGGIHGGGPPWA